MTRTIPVYYTCKSCQLIKRAVQVPSRSPGEAIESWMDTVSRHIANDHSNRSPHCTSRKMEHLFIPLGKDNEPIGSPVENPGPPPDVKE